MANLDLYDKVRTVPQNAQKEIKGGRLSGKTDINPMWRLKTLTEQFGPCGIGWKYTIDKQWLEDGSNGEKSAFVNISLYIKVGEKWSEPIPGTGGSMFIENESKGLHTSDECFKMALTDAISVACKALGMGADVYWEKDSSKYDRPAINAQDSRPTGIESVSTVQPKCADCGKEITTANVTFSTRVYGKALCRDCQSKNPKIA